MFFAAGPVAGTLGDVELSVTRCDTDSYDISWQTSSSCEEGKCYLTPIFTCDNEVNKLLQLSRPTDIISPSLKSLLQPLLLSLTIQ